jgi:hypothetical protein
MAVDTSHEPLAAPPGVCGHDVRTNGARSRRRWTYGNFADPFGLAWRLVTQGGWTGQAALAREALAKALAPLDLAMQGAERRLLQEPQRSDRPLVLIVGPPRSGTTLVSQVLARALRVSLFTNLNAMFPRSPLSAAKLFARWQPPPQGPVQSLYGVTPRLNDVNDGFHVWDRFLGTNRYYAPNRISDASVRGMQEFFGRWTAITGLPLLTKNNRNLACAAELARALPNAYFICVRRDPLPMAQSLLKARRWIQGDAESPWGLFARDARETASSLASVDAVADQVNQLTRTMGEQRARVDASRWLDLDYEDFCRSPEAAVERVAAVAPEVELRSSQSPNVAPKLRASSHRELPVEIVQRLESRLVR